MLSGLTPFSILSVMTDFAQRMSPQTKVLVGYLIAGVVIGAMWLGQAGHSLAEHALRLVALMAIVMALTTAVQRRRAAQGRLVKKHPIGRFLAMKLGLVAAAVVADLALAQWVTTPDPWVALGLVVVVAVGGPLLHPWLTKSDDRQAVAH
jgi:hypothetical protein